MNTTQSSTHSLGLRTKQIDIAVEQGLIISRGGGVDDHLASAVALWSILLHYLSPKQTGSTELGNLHKIVLADTHIELNALGSQVNIDTCIHELLQVLVTPSECIAQLLNDISTGIVQSISADSNATEVRIVLEDINKSSSKRQEGRNILALHHHLLHGVPLDRANHLLLVVALLCEEVDQNLSQLNRMFRTGGEVHLDTVAIDTVEQCLNVLLADHLARKLEAQRVDTLVQDVECLGVSCLYIVNDDILANIPRIRIFLVTTNEGEFAGQRIRSLEVFQILTTIERLYIKAFIGSPYESFLEVGSFQVNLNFVQPLLGGRRLELAEECFFVCHKF